jgi:hypothetical protein
LATKIGEHLVRQQREINALRVLILKLVARLVASGAVTAADLLADLADVEAGLIRRGASDVELDILAAWAAAASQASDG